MKVHHSVLVQVVKLNIKVVKIWGYIFEIQEMYCLAEGRKGRFSKINACMESQFLRYDSWKCVMGALRLHINIL